MKGELWAFHTLISLSEPYGLIHDILLIATWAILGKWPAYFRFDGVCKFCICG